MKSNRSMAILGGGMLGLALAWRLSARGAAVTVFEAAEELGGLTQHTANNGVTWDRFYHVIDASDQALLGLLDEIGLATAVQWRTTRTLFYDGRAHYPLNNSFDYLALPALSLIDKMRVGGNIIYAGARRRRGALETISAEQWLTRWSGRRAYEQLWAPLLRSKLGTNYDKISAAYIWSVIRRFYGAREGSQRTERFGFMPGGYARIIASLSAALQARGVEIRCAAPVCSVIPDRSGGLEVTSGAETYRFDSVVATLAAPLVAGICTGLSETEKARHRALSYQGVVCLSVLLDRPLGGAYMTYMTDNSLPFTTVIEMSALTGIENFNGHHLVYLPRYVPADDTLFAADDAQIEATFLDGLARLYPDFERAGIAASHIARARYVMTVPKPHYSATLPALETSVPGLFVCNSSRIVDASLSVTEAVALADKTAPDLYPA